MDHTRRLRREQTDVEARLWHLLRNQQPGVKFRRQHRIGGYIVDFVCAAHWLVIELDGGQHAERLEYDAERTAFLVSRGFRVLRFWNHDVIESEHAVMDRIWSVLREVPPHPGPLPRGRGRGSRAAPAAPSARDGPSPRSGDDRYDLSTDPIKRAQDSVDAFPSPSQTGRDGVPALPFPGAQRDKAVAWRPCGSIAALRLRARLYASIRAFFAEREVLEVETPVLSMAGNTDPNIASFSTAFSGRSDGAPPTRWLRTSPEFALKRLLAAGVGDCYELGRVFRDGEAGGRHNPEFAMLEWYRVGWDHLRLAEETIALVRSALALVGRDARVEHCTFEALYRERLGVDPFRDGIETLRDALGDVRIDPEGLQRDDWLDLLMTHRLQPAFDRDLLLVVRDWPASQCALAKIRPGTGGDACADVGKHDVAKHDVGNHDVAERFELYLGPLELANGYHELTDAEEQRQRFARDLQVRAARGAHALPIDAHLLSALVAGLPPCAGVALGVERLLMAMLGTERIADTLAFDFPRA